MSEKKKVSRPCAMDDFGRVLKFFWTKQMKRLMELPWIPRALLLVCWTISSAVKAIGGVQTWERVWGRLGKDGWYGRQQGGWRALVVQMAIFSGELTVMGVGLRMQEVAERKLSSLAAC
jgi:hypothetical protein